MKIIPTSNKTANVDDIILREKKTVRLVFRPLLVENPRLSEASLKGHFIYQKKGVVDEWKDIETESLSHLKKGEFVTLEIKSAELLKLFNEISALYKIYEEEGIPWHPTDYVKLDSHIEGFLKATETDLYKFLGENINSSVEITTKIFKWISSLDDISSIINSLETIDSETLHRISSLAGLRALEDCYQEWENNQDNDSEQYWQKLLENNSYVLLHMFAQPYIIMRGNAYVGGKNIENAGGSMADFLMRNHVTNNVVIIEIKTPATSILGPEYRAGIFPISKELSGAISQITKYRHDLLNDYYALCRNTQKFTAFDPPCMVICGHAKNELSEEPRLRSFELLRKQLTKVQVVTFDEIFGKIKLLLDTIKGNEFNQ